MENKDFNRICELSGILLEDNREKIISIITDKIYLPYQTALNMVTIANDKKPLALWIANTFKKALINDKLFNSNGEQVVIPSMNHMALKRYFGVKEGNPKKYIDYYPFGTPERPESIRIGAVTVANDVKLVKGCDELINGTFNKITKEQYISILDWWSYHAQPGRTQINLKDYDFDSAFELSKKWHEELEAKKREGAVEEEKKNALIMFNDGWYWLDLNSTNCPEEAEYMGHCARTSYGDTLISLRDKEGQPHLTMSYSEKSKIEEEEISDEIWNTYHQLKGRKNSKPKEEYHEKIVALFKKLDINNYDTEYNPQNDFHIHDLNDKLLKKLLTSNKNLYNNLPIADKLKLYKRIGYKNPLFTAKTDKYTKFAKNGVKLIVDNWATLSNLFDKDHEKIAQEVFDGDIQQYYNYYDMGVDLNDVWDDINDNLLNEIKKLLINTEYEDKRLTSEDINKLDLKEFVDNEKNNMASEIKDNIKNAYRRGYETVMMDGVYSKYTETITNVFGEAEYKKNKLVFTISYDEFSEWIERYLETGYEEELTEPISVYDIIRHTLGEEDKLLVPPPEDKYEGGYGINYVDLARYFNEDLLGLLSEIDELSFKESKEQLFSPGMKESYLNRIKVLSGL